MSVALETCRSFAVLLQSTTKTEEYHDLMRRCVNAFSHLGTKAMSEIRAIPSSVTEKTFCFTGEDLRKYLYGKKQVEKIDLERILRKRKLLDFENPANKRARILTEHFSEELDNIEMTYSIMSLPNDVQLCYSSIPGCRLGVCSTKNMPAGTWIGPYEGKRVAKAAINGDANKSSYCWEIYKDGKLDHFLDGSDKHSSSWMRYIRCARTSQEQNMYVVQYGPNIFYRSFKAIKPGEELLVWYENQYEQHFGIPMFIKLASFGKANKTRINPGVHPSQQLAVITQNAMLTEKSSPAHFNKHNGLTLPPDVNGTFTSSIHYNGYTQLDSLGSISPPLSASPVASPTSDQIPTHEPLDDQEIGLWKCGQCQQRFTQRSALRLHVCPSHADNPYHCGHCSLSFANPSKLRDHVLTHNNERPFKCGFCSRTFAGATTLNNHVRTHTGQKPFTCEKCGKSFAQASQMSRHQRIADDCKS